ncbi:ahpC/TSA family protein [Sarocladium implicatum]|nr:ahpC/TSA family protein [Sarocladium implicatum]
MPVTLRERKPAAAPPAPVAKSKVTKAKATNGKAASAATKKTAAAVAKADVKAEDAPAPTKSKKSSGGDKAGDEIDLEGFGGTIETNDGEETTLKELVDKSRSGVVLFTYPKASTPGCTKQVCFFRDAYTALTSTGLAIYGLSADSAKANTTFKTKQSLPYPLLCDTKRTLIKAIGLLKEGSKTQRGVWVVSKEGKVRVSEAGGPEATMERVKKLVEAGV